MGKITIKWNAGASEESSLSASSPRNGSPCSNGTEAWSEFRRTGYPDFPRTQLSDQRRRYQQIRRMVFPQSEYSTTARVGEAVKLLGGPDNGGTKLWWDKKN
ncbi:MAG: SusD/RagB family nutrient-binding outer membrane lipoprotein [Alistipes sp.]